MFWSAFLKMAKYPYSVISNGDWLWEAVWVENKTASGLCYFWFLRFPFSLPHDSLPLTLACEVHRKLKELQDSSLWDLPWLSSWARRVAWRVHCPCWPLPHFFHRTIRDCAARMGLKVDFKWFLLMSDTESVKDTSLILMDASAIVLIGLQSAQVYSIPCPLLAPCSEGGSDLGLAVPISSKGFQHPCSAVPTGSSSNWWSVLTPIDMVTLCFPGSVAGLEGPKLYLPHSFWPWALRLFSWYNVWKAGVGR